MRKVVIAGQEMEIPEERVTIRCPKCARKIPHYFIKKAYALLGEKHIQRDKAYFVELGLKGMASRWNKPVERLRKRYLKRKAKQGNLTIDKQSRV